VDQKSDSLVFLFGQHLIKGISAVLLASVIAVFPQAVDYSIRSFK
jgi:hypothetical protein